MSDSSSWLPLSRTVAHYTCRTAGCRRREQDVLPSLRSCPACGTRLVRRDLP